MSKTGDYYQELKELNNWDDADKHYEDEQVEKHYKKKKKERDNDRSFRAMVARLGVYSKRKTTNRKSFAHKLDNSYVLVFDMQKREYRMVNLETLKYIKMNGREYAIS